MPVAYLSKNILYFPYKITILISFLCVCMSVATVTLFLLMAKVLSTICISNQILRLLICGPNVCLLLDPSFRELNIFFIWILLWDSRRLNGSKVMTRAM